MTAPVILKGLLNTVTLTIYTMILGIVLGVIFAMMTMSSNPVVGAMARFYIWFFRGTPLLLQLLLWFNLALVFPRLGIPGLFEYRTVDKFSGGLRSLLGLGIGHADRRGTHLGQHGTLVLINNHLRIDRAYLPRQVPVNHEAHRGQCHQREADGQHHGGGGSYPACVARGGRIGRRQFSFRNLRDRLVVHSNFLDRGIRQRPNSHGVRA
jgi:His/Glu/Gln/Arg/opine family amino acid ABC transporter permease subunit